MKLYGIEENFLGTKPPTLQSVEVEKETAKQYWISRSASVSWLRYGTRIDKDSDLVHLTPEAAWSEYLHRKRELVERALAEVTEAKSRLVIGMSAESRWRRGL